MIGRVSTRSDYVPTLAQPQKPRAIKRLKSFECNEIVVPPAQEPEPQHKPVLRLDVPMSRIVQTKGDALRILGGEPIHEHVEMSKQLALTLLGETI